jgi:hypothetical protein
MYKRPCARPFKFYLQMSQNDPISDAPAPPELLPVPVYKKDVSIPRLGQVGGIATDAVGRLVVFHRASRVWNMNSFDWSNHFQVNSTTRRKKD